MYYIKVTTIIFVLFFSTYSCTKVNNSPLKVNITVNNNTKIDENSPIVIYGDTRNNYNIHRQVVRAFLKKKPTIVFNTGDLVYNGDNTELWPKFFSIIEPILKTARYYPVLGNHENNSVNYFKTFNLPNNERWYYIDFKNTRFFILDSNSDLSPNSKQYIWLNSKLESTTSKFKVLVFHYPLYSVGRHGGEVNLRNNLMELIQKYKIQLIFSGHDHSYQRFFKDGINYIVTGGGGAPLYGKEYGSNDEKYLKKFLKTYHYCLINTNSKELSVEVYNLKNILIDELIIK